MGGIMLFTQACEKKGKAAFNNVQFCAKHSFEDSAIMNNDTIRKAFYIIDDTALVAGKDTDTKGVINVFRKKSEKILKDNPKSLEGKSYREAAKALEIEDERLSKNPIYSH